MLSLFVIFHKSIDTYTYYRSLNSVMWPAGIGIQQLPFVEPNYLCVTKTCLQLLKMPREEGCPAASHSLSCAPASAPKILLPRAVAAGICIDQLQHQCRGKRKYFFLPYFTSKSICGMYLEICWSTLIIQLIGRWVIFFFLSSHAR